MRIHRKLAVLGIVAVVGLASAAGVAISQESDDDAVPESRAVLTDRVVPLGRDHYGPAPAAGDFPPSLAEGCAMTDGPSFRSPDGGRDLSRVPRWISVGGQDAAGKAGIRGCVARELLFPQFDAGEAYHRLAEAAGVQHPPLPVFTPDGALAGYIVHRFRLVEQALAEGLVPDAFLARPPVPQDFEPGA